MTFILFLALSAASADDQTIHAKTWTLGELVEQADRFHDQTIELVGRVRWSRCDKGCLIEMTDENDPSSSLLAQMHGVSSLEGVSITGRRLKVNGLFYQKVYPRYRMARWQELGWRKDESLPAAALI
ncbi:MAG: hypothetical protein HN348_33105, partial [Proteobacteria bacterium]|nr:hypothetical protein [Pseudomonadota bacterium]